ncbi:hypothetical protein SBV1_470019 [Verrucomicrobia bacterium]|nr:hypothetical protein SBV1_470019 [Verrucomicrobiota bacterium]
MCVLLFVLRLFEAVHCFTLSTQRRGVKRKLTPGELGSLREGTEVRKGCSGRQRVTPPHAGPK